MVCCILLSQLKTRDKTKTGQRFTCAAVGAARQHLLAGAERGEEPKTWPRSRAHAACSYTMNDMACLVTSILPVHSSPPPVSSLRALSLLAACMRVCVCLKIYANRSISTCLSISTSPSFILAYTAMRTTPRGGSGRIMMKRRRQRWRREGKIFRRQDQGVLVGEQKGQEGKRPGTRWDAYRGEIGAWGGPEVDRFWEDSNCLDSSRYFVDLHRMRTCWEERVRGRGSACSCLPVSRACPCLFAHFLCFPTHYVWGREQGLVWLLRARCREHVHLWLGRRERRGDE